MDERSRPPARQRDHKVSIPEITATALAMIDEHGMDALTMRGLADAIGVTPMTLYRYLPNKDTILAEVADLLWRELPPIDPAITGWKEQLTAMWQQLFDLMLRHPHAVPLIARGGTYSATASSDTAGMLAVLKDAGFPAELAGQFVHAASALVVGYAFAHVEGAARPTMNGVALVGDWVPLRNGDVIELAGTQMQFIFR